MLGFPILPLATGGVEPLGQGGNQHRNLVLVDELKGHYQVEAFSSEYGGARTVVMPRWSLCAIAPRF